jgi:mannose-6-phosphate isomerase-like protein (cupin superfamily)
MKITPLLFSFSLLAHAATVDIIPSPQLDKLQKKITGQKIGIEALAHYSNSSMQLIRRESSGSAELHQTKADILVVRDGEATLIEGGSIPNPKTTQPHEVRGESIQGGTRHTLGAGDVVHIPAGVPHQLLLAPGKTFSYLAIKIDQ